MCGDGQLAEPFDVGEERGATVFLEYGAQQLTEQAYVGPQRCRYLETRMHTRR